MTYQGQGVPGGQGQQQQQRWAKTYTAAVTATANAAGLIRLTLTAHKFNTGNNVTVANVGGTVEANGSWVATKSGVNTIDLVGSTFTNAWTSGGTVVRH